MIKQKLITVNINPCSGCAFYLCKYGEDGFLKEGCGCRADKEHRDECTYTGEWFKIKRWENYHKKTN